MIPINVPYNIPTLYIGNKQGHTDYIDFITLDDMTHSIMRGIDVYNRRFIVIKMIINNIQLMQTFFQRYPEREGLWMGAGHGVRHLIDTTGGMKDCQFKLIDDIINNKIVKIKEEHKPCVPSFKDNYVCNETIYNSVIIIQKAWRLCRYNPKYKMCEKVLMTNLHDISR